MSVQDCYASVGALRLHFRDWSGPTGDAPALVMLHGGMGDAELWDVFAPILATRFRVIAPDARGHGASDWSPGREYAVEHQVDDLVGIVAMLGYERASIVGASMGGWTAYNVAARYPALVEKLVVVDVSPEIPVSQRNEMQDSIALAKRVRSIEEAVDSRLREKKGRNEPFQRAYVERNLVRQADGSYAWRYDVDGLLLGGIGSRDGPREWELLRRIEAPTLLVRGAESEVLTPELAQRVCTAIAGSSLVEVSSAGHSVPAEQPALFLAAIVPFLFGD
jgi:esterase